MKIQTAYWRNDMVVQNLGDYITELLISRMGHTPIRYGSGEEFDNNGCLLAVGSLLGHWDFTSRIKGPIAVWGTGARGPEAKAWAEANAERITFHAVRGPLSAEVLELDSNFPQGDPALLLPHYIQQGEASGRISYIPHIGSLPLVKLSEIAEVGANHIIPVTCLREEAESRIQEISGSAFVLTGSLHGAIIAQAYGVPWAICIPKHRNLVMPFKFKDWFAYLGIEPAIVENYHQGKAWWEAHGSKYRSYDTNQILNSFPH